MLKSSLYSFFYNGCVTDPFPVLLLAEAVEGLSCSNGVVSCSNFLSGSSILIFVSSTNSLVIDGALGCCDTKSCSGSLLCSACSELLLSASVGSCVSASLLASGFFFSPSSQYVVIRPFPCKHTIYEIIAQQIRDILLH